MAIRTQNGRVLTKAGKVSCQCCTIDIPLEYNFGPQGECDCNTIECYDAATNPSPASFTVGGVEYPNEVPGTDRVRLPRITIQGPITVEKSLPLAGPRLSIISSICKRRALMSFMIM